MRFTGEEKVDDDQHEEAEDVEGEAAVLLILQLLISIFWYFWNVCNLFESMNLGYQEPTYDF